MKILNYINNLGAGGAEKLLTDVLPIQKSKGHQVAVMISNNAANVKNFEVIMAANDIQVHNLNTSFYNPFQVIKLVQILRKEKFDIVHAHLFPTQYWLAIASYFLPKKTRLVKTEHANFNERQQYKVLRLLEKWKYSRYDGIIGITNSVKKNLSEWIQSSKNMVVIENGVNLDQIKEKQTQYNPIDYQFISPSNFNMLMVARIDGNQKDHASCIEALHILKDDDIHLYFAGAGPAEDELKQRVEDLNLTKNVHFLGVRTDVYVLMSLVDLNILSTNFEGLSGVALESMASGKAFIGTDVGGVNDVVPDATFLFPQEAPTALAAKIKELKINDTLRTDMAEQAMAHVQKSDIKLMANAYLELYKTLS